MRFLKKNWTLAASFAMLAVGLACEWRLVEYGWSALVRLLWYLVAVLPVAVPVLREMLEEWAGGTVFNEFFLMAAAAVAAFVIGEYPEGLAVLLFYTIGERMQDAAVSKAHSQIESLLSVCPSTAVVVRGGVQQEVDPASVQVGETVLVKPGCRVPLDGELLCGQALFDTSAITGESAPRSIAQGEPVLSGMMATAAAVRVKVTKPFSHSTMNRILDMVENANSRKSNTELFIRKFARCYTSVVMLLVVLVILVPYLACAAGYTTSYDWKLWLGKAAVFMVVSCPCALLVSIPLGYFGGIGAASRHGILIKGGNYLDALYKVRAVAFDKTGTLTQGQFRVSGVELGDGFTEQQLFASLAGVEAQSNHPMAKAVCQFADDHSYAALPAEAAEEVAGRGLRAECGGRVVLAGNARLLQEAGVDVPADVCNLAGALVLCAIGGRFAGCVALADEPKAGTLHLAHELKEVGVSELHILSGDRQQQVDSLAAQLGFRHALGNLLPDGKVKAVEALRQRMPVAFVGDGINDAPVLALADVGIAMGAMGSDVAVEAADVVIEDDQPGKVAVAIQIARNTRNVVWQNVAMALGCKLAVMALALFGIANMWMGVFADSGVALLAVLNAVRIQRKNFGGYVADADGSHRSIKAASACLCGHHHHHHGDGHEEEYEKNKTFVIK